MADATLHRRANIRSLASLYVGDIDFNVTEDEILSLFSKVGHVVSVRICRDHRNQKPLGYGYVNYLDDATASKAIKQLNYTALKGKQIRVSMYDLNASYRVKGGNVFVKNLHESIDNKKLHEMFSAFGDILSCKVNTKESGESKCFGFVQFNSEESAKKAVEHLNGAKVQEKEIYVGPFISHINKTNLFTNVFVKNFTETTSEDELRGKFETFGKIASLALMRHEDGTSKCFGFIDFENPENAVRSVEALNGRVFNGRRWYVGRAQKKSERIRELRLQRKRIFGSNNLYVKNLGHDIDEDGLRSMFAPFGRVISCKVVCDEKGIKKGVGYVAFSTFQEATKAILEMNGKMMGRRPLYVTVLQRKQDRLKRLQALFQNMQENAIFPSLYHCYGPNISNGQAASPLYPPMPVDNQLFSQTQQRYIFDYYRMILGSINYNQLQLQNSQRL